MVEMSDNGDKPIKLPERRGLTAKDVIAAINASGQEVNEATARNPNAGDGSATPKQFARTSEGAKQLAQQGESISIVDDMKGLKTSRTNVLKESDFNQPASPVDNQPAKPVEIASYPHKVEPVRPEPETPVEGEQILVQTLLGMKTDISSACEKSPTLKSLVANMKQHPWAVNVVFIPRPKMQEYDAGSNTITVDTKLSSQKQVDSFGHELYHSTHQSLDKLYSSPTPVSLESYKQIRMDGETGAFLAEFKVNRELRHTERMTFDYVQGKTVRKLSIGSLIHYNSSGEVDDEKSKQSIAKFLRENRAPEIDNQGNPVYKGDGSIATTYYPADHEKDFSKYLQFFDENRRELMRKGWLGKGM